MLEFVCNVDELLDGVIKQYSVEGRRLIVVRCGDDVYAINSTCPHKGAPLSDGCVSVARREVICPWHRFRFDLVTGKSVTNPDLGTRAYSTVVQDGKVYISIS